MSWQAMVLRTKKSSIVQGNLKRVHYAFEDGREMVEEYNMDTSVLTRRAWRKKTELGASSDEWDIEIGDPEPIALRKENEFIKENSNEPFISRRVTKKSLEWRIRNLPYPVEIYTITTDTDNKCITVRTTNKKYFKRITVPELERVNMLPEQDRITFTHKFNTLIITYAKPDEVLALEKLIFEEVKKVKPQQETGFNECKPS